MTQIVKAAEPLELVKRFMGALEKLMEPSDLWEKSPVAPCLTTRESKGISLALYLLRRFISRLGRAISKWISHFVTLEQRGIRCL